MIMDADIEVEYQGKKYWVNSYYWNTAESERIVLRNEKGEQYNKELNCASLNFNAEEMAFVPRSEVKLWEEPVLFDNSDRYKPVLYKGKKFYILKCFSDADRLLLCTNTSGSSGKDFAERSKVHEYFDLVPVNWKGSKKVYYVRRDRWGGLLYNWVTLRNKSGVPYVTGKSGGPVKDKENSLRWFYAQRVDLKQVEEKE